MKDKKIELLAPAANFAGGKAAIDAGADAVYIGGPSFGAREKAGNSIEEIARLAEYAHVFGAKVYLTMNTIIYDEELADAERLVWQAWDSGVDAVIVQDMALLEMKLPPVPLHASTQTFNLSVERAAFLGLAGFDRVILERAVTLSEIKGIGEKTDVEIEAFVHGAICVGYSGQCYLSHSLCGRSGNRGACAQPCRSLWTVTDENGRTLARNRTILSVGDLNLSEHLSEMIHAGVTSLKIEGRLKDVDYVTNNVAYYNKRLVELGVGRVADGVSHALFEPNPEKSFSRSFSDYLFVERMPKRSLLNKSQGEYLGKIVRVGRDYFELDRTVSINNGDGIVFAAKCQDDGSGQNNFSGTNINTVANDGRIFPNRMDGFVVGMEIYRNLDRSFAPRAVRKISAVVTFADGLVTVEDSTGVNTSVRYEAVEQAVNVERAADNIRNAFSKSGDTIFEIIGVDVVSTPFMPMSRLNEMRRELLEKLRVKRIETYRREERRRLTAYPQYPATEIDYRGNVANRLARGFYEKCGVGMVGRAYELSRPLGAELMRTRHCVRRELGICLKEKSSPRGELYIENNGRKFRLVFHCAECEMTVVD